MRQRDFPTSNKLNMNESDTLKSVYSFSLTYFSHWGCRFSTTAVDTFTPAQTPLSAGSNCVATSKYRVCTERCLANNELILAGNIITLCSKVMFTKKKKKLTKEEFLAVPQSITQLWETWGVCWKSPILGTVVVFLLSSKAWLWSRKHKAAAC